MNNSSTDASPAHDTLIQKSIGRRLISWGYDQELKKPDLLITYRFYYEDFDYKGFSQPDFEYWVRKKFYNAGIAPKNVSEDVIINNLQTEETGDDADDPEINNDEEYKTVVRELRQGVIFITFYDRKRDQSIWNGYMAGVFQNNSMENERFLMSSVGKILDDYRILARGYKYLN